MKQTKTITRLRPFYLLLLVILFAVGCKRDTTTQNPKSSELTSTTSGKNSSTLIYRATEQQVAAAKNAWLQKARAQKGNTAARGGCGEHISDFIYILQVTASGCPASSWDIRYLIYSYDYVGSGYELAPQSASFTDMYFGFPISATLISSSESLVDPDCKDWQWDGYCEMVRVYEYQLTSVPAPSSAWPSDIGNFSLDLLSGFSNNCTPITVSGDMKGGLTAAEYASSMARVSVVPAGGPGSIYVGTDCSLTCPPPQFVCPTGGVLQYWPLSNPTNVTTVAIASNGNFVSSIPTGVTYGYSCVLNYVIGGVPVSSLPQTGTFTL
ncbi:MAG: hypothetical protein JNJ86_13205 [Chitinophagaceae bacterium]|jgi:hypothetical protein|nr:hypothetical protein [Chitinophagaceae bacterium]